MDRHHRRVTLVPVVEDALGCDVADRVAPNTDRAILGVSTNPVGVRRTLGLVDRGQELAVALVVDAFVVLVDHRGRDGLVEVIHELLVRGAVVLLRLDLGLGRRRGLDRLLVTARLADLAATGRQTKHHRHHQHREPVLALQHVASFWVRPGCLQTTAR